MWWCGNGKIRNQLAFPIGVKVQGIVSGMTIAYASLKDMLVYGIVVSLYSEKLVPIFFFKVDQPIQITVSNCERSNRIAFIPHCFPSCLAKKPMQRPEGVLGFTIMHVKYEPVCLVMEYGEEQCKGLHANVHAKISKTS